MQMIFTMAMCGSNSPQLPEPLHRAVLPFTPTLLMEKATIPPMKVTNILWEISPSRSLPPPYQEKTIPLRSFLIAAEAWLHRREARAHAANYSGMQLAYSE